MSIDRPRLARIAWRSWLVSPWLLILAIVLYGLAEPSSSGPASGIQFEQWPGEAVIEPQADRLRVASFNIHSGVGTDGRFDLSRTAELLKDFDFVGLNEVRGTGYHARAHNQAYLLGESHRVPWLFAPTERQWDREMFGNGALCRFAVRGYQRIPLPGTSGRGLRNCLLTYLPAPQGDVRLLVTHLDRTVDRPRQLETVAELFLALAPPVILLGDLNTPRSDPLLAKLLRNPEVIDAVGVGLERQVAAAEDPSKAADFPERIDWILVRGMEVVAGGIVHTTASDHPLVWAELKLVDIP